MSFCKLICFGIQGDTWFDQALREAQKGIGFTHPNPPVGCVIVKDNKLIATGYHPKAGELHAEARALLVAGEAARGSTLYVTLEPCNHFGRTPPCTQAIVKAGVKRVIYGVSDPNPNVAGQGSKVLREAGIEVEELSSPEARALIEPFSKLVREKRPYILAKIATSLDGKIAFKSGEQTQITGPETRKLVHLMREACDAVLVGSETVLVDNPQLTARFEDRPAKRQPARIVLDSRQRTNSRHKIYTKDGVPSYRLTSLEQLDDLGFTSILLEGGGVLLTSFLEQNRVDELAWFTAPILIGNQGVPAISGLAKAISVKQDIFRVPIGIDFLTLFCQKAQHG